MLLRVQDGVRHALLLENLGDGAALLDAGGADENGLPALVVLEDLSGDGGELLALRLVDEVFLVFAEDGLVRRDDDDVQLVRVVELFRFGVGRPRHAADLLVEAEQVLERDRRHRARFLLDPHVFLGFDGLVEAIGPATTGEHAAGELVDDEDLLVVGHEVVHVALVERVRLEALVQDVERLEVHRIVEVPETHELLRGVHALVREADGVALLVDDVVLVLLEARDDVADAAVFLARSLGLAADDERGARLVDQDRVDLVHDGVVELALGVLQRGELHVVAQVVEAKLVILAVGDVAAVRVALLPVALVGDDDAGAEAEEAIELGHPLGVALGEVVVHGDDVHALAGERVQVTRQRGDQGFTLAGAHLRDVALVEHHAADELHVVVAHLQGALAALAAHGERVDQDVVDRGAVGELLFELRGLGLEVGVLQLAHLGLESVDLLDHRAEFFDLPLVRGAEDFLHGPSEHGCAR